MLPWDEPAEHVEEKQLELYLKHQLNQDELSLIDTHLAACENCASKLVEQDACLWYLAELTAETAAVEGERRAQPRVETDDPALLQVLNPFAAGAWDVRIVDVSDGGLRARTPRILAPGSLIKVQMRYSVACGDVRYCVAADDAFYAGVRLHDYFRASSAAQTSRF